MIAGAIKPMIGNGATEVKKNRPPFCPQDVPSDIRFDGVRVHFGKESPPLPFWSERREGFIEEVE